MEREPKPSVAERMQAVTRGLMEAGLVDRREVAERYSKLQEEAEPVEMNTAEAIERTRQALADAREKLKNIPSRQREE